MENFFEYDEYEEEEDTDDKDNDADDDEYDKMYENNLADILQDTNHFQVPQETEEEQDFFQRSRRKLWIIPILRSR